MTARALVIGEGAWGRRVAAKLQALAVPVMSFDPLFNDAWSAMQEWEPTHVVVAVPPHAHRDTALDALRWFPSMTDLRVEKPGCENEDDLLDVLAAGDRADVQVSVGYTLAAHVAHRAITELYDVAELLSMRAVRISRGSARHDVSALMDLGAHAAYLAARARLHPDDVEIVCGHDGDRDVRITRYEFESHTFLVDEVAEVVSVEGTGVTQPMPPGTDALAVELGAFVEGVPLVMGETAIDAHRILAAQAVLA